MVTGTPSGGGNTTSSMTSTHVPKANGTTSLVDSGIIEAGSPLTTQVTNGPMTVLPRTGGSGCTGTPDGFCVDYTTGTGSIGVGGSDQIIFRIGGSAVANLTTAGIFQDTNGITSTPIGAASPSTGGFTTLGASGNVTFPGLDTGGTVAGSICATSAGLFEYKVGINCFAASGSLTTTDGTHSVVATTTMTFGAGFLVGGSAGSATVNTILAPLGPFTVAQTITAADVSTLIEFSNSSPISQAIPAVNTTGFTNGTGMCFQMRGSGTVTLTSATAFSGGSVVFGQNATPCVTADVANNVWLVSEAPGGPLAGIYKLGTEFDTTTTPGQLDIGLGGISSSMLASGAAAANVSTLGGVLTGTLPNPGMAATAVSPGTYTNANITVGADGRLTAATTGTGGGATSVVSGNDVTVSGSPCSTSCTVNVKTQGGVAAGAYTNSNITVDAQGIITAVANGSASGVTPTITVFDTVGAGQTWTWNAGYINVFIKACGPGGGGGGGGIATMADSSHVAAGGAGGGGGECKWRMFKASDIAGNITVNVTDGGAAGNGASGATGAAGSTGTAGTDVTLSSTALGTFLTAHAGGGGSAGGSGVGGSTLNSTFGCGGWYGGTGETGILATTHTTSDALGCIISNGNQAHNNNNNSYAKVNEAGAAGNGSTGGSVAAPAGGFPSERSGVGGSPGGGALNTGAGNGATGEISPSQISYPTGGTSGTPTGGNGADGTGEPCANGSSAGGGYGNNIGNGGNAGTAGRLAGGSGGGAAQTGASNTAGNGSKGGRGCVAIWAW